MLEGHPLDGSRSIYHNALRLRTPLVGGDLDLALIYNPKRDPDRAGRGRGPGVDRRRRDGRGGALDAWASSTGR